MWIIKNRNGYLTSFNPVEFNPNRDIAKRMTREEAREVKEKYNIHGSIIPG